MRFLKARPRVMVVVALGVLLLIAAPIVSAQWPFPDVNTGDWFYNDVRRIAYLNITQGYPDGTYKPYNNVTRAEMAAFLNRLSTAWTNQNEPYIFRVDNMDNGAGQSGDGIIARSYAGVGLRGESYGGANGSDGVVGWSNKGPWQSGVYGSHGTDGFGVTGRSTSGFGMYAIGAGDGTALDRVGDLRLDGDRGEVFSFGTFLNLYSDRDVQVHLDDNNNDANGTFTIWNGTNTLLFVVDETGLMWAINKASAVKTENQGQRLLYAIESPEVWFEDFGSASLVNGEATVAIDPLFAETVNLEADYHLFLTPLGECNGLYVAAKSPTSFEVRELGGGTASIGFDYRIVAKRLGYEDLRLETPTVSSGGELRAPRQVRWSR